MTGQTQVRDGAVWLVTGSSRGLGRALAEAVLASGDRLVATALPSEMERLKPLACFGDRVRTFALDVRDPEAAQAAVDAAVAAFGRLDVVVNNAGYGDVGSIEDTELAAIRAQVETNLFGTIHVTKAALPQLRRQGSGRFIQFSSIAGRVAPAGRGAYAAAKWGVEGFSEALAREVAPLGLQVTIVEPGGFRTDFAGASTTFREPQPAYAGTVGRSIAYQREYDGRQPGDPRKAAEALLTIARAAAPPLRLVLGSDAYGFAKANEDDRARELEAWRALSLSTDFEADPGEVDLNQRRQ